jgi:membrane associated rhomboid family serine protease
LIPLKDNVPTRSFPLVTVAIIGVNTLVWIWEFTGTSVEHDVLRYGYYPCTVQSPCASPAAGVPHLSWWDGAFTSMFMHGSWFHIIGNMLFLWIFGNNVEDSMGRIRFAIWYLLCGLAATASQTYVTLQFGDAQSASIPNVGASGAIAGVLGAYFLLLPTASVLTAIFVVFIFFLQELPAILFLGIWFLFQLWEGGFSLIEPQAGGGVAFFAHIGGFVFGMLTVRAVIVREPLRPTW